MNSLTENRKEIRDIRQCVFGPMNQGCGKLLSEELRCHGATSTLLF